MAEGREGVVEGREGVAVVDSLGRREARLRGREGVDGGASFLFFWYSCSQVISLPSTGRFGAR